MGEQLETSLSSKSATISTQKLEIDQLSSKIKELEDSNKFHKVNHENYQAMMENEKKENEKLLEQQENDENEINTLTEEIEANQLIISELKNENHATAQEMEQLTEKYSNIQEQFQMLKDDVEKA